MPRNIKIISIIILLLLLSGIIIMTQNRSIPEISNSEEPIKEVTTNETSDMASTTITQEIAQSNTTPNSPSVENVDSSDQLKLGLVSILTSCSEMKDSLTYNNQTYGYDGYTGYIATLSEPTMCLKIIGSDSTSFRLLEGDYFIDKNSVYYHDYSNEQVFRISLLPDSFMILNSEFTIAKDAERVYMGEKTFSDIDATSFTLLDSESPYATDRLFATDANSFFYITRIRNLGKTDIQLSTIESLDPKTFTFINASYVKDKNAVYFLHSTSSVTLVQDADPDTFATSTITPFFYEDKTHLYYKDTRLSLDPKKTSPVEGTSNYFIYMDQVYYFDSSFDDFAVVEGADSKTFKSTSRYGTDKNHAYYTTTSIDGVDVASFEVIDSMYAKDKDSVYQNGVLLKDKDPKKFKSPLFPCFEC